jgi:hypothetical protein
VCVLVCFELAPTLLSVSGTLGVGKDCDDYSTSRERGCRVLRGVMTELRAAGKTGWR